MDSSQATSSPPGGQSDGERAAGIILYRRAPDGAPRFLLLKTRKGGHYSPPKGHLDPGEAFEDAARRETREEAGLAPRSLDPGFRVTIEYDVVKRGRPCRKAVVYYLGEAAEGDVVLSDEHTAARWEPLAEVRRLLPFRNLLDVFESAARRLDDVARGGAA